MSTRQSCGVAFGDDVFMLDPRIREDDIGCWCGNRGVLGFWWGCAGVGVF